MDKMFAIYVAGERKHKFKTGLHSRVRNTTALNLKQELNKRSCSVAFKKNFIKSAQRRQSRLDVGIGNNSKPELLESEEPSLEPCPKWRHS